MWVARATINCASIAEKTLKRPVDLLECWCWTCQENKSTSTVNTRTCLMHLVLPTTPPGVSPPKMLFLASIALFLVYTGLRHPLRSLLHTESESPSYWGMSSTLHTPGSPLFCRGVSVDVTAFARIFMLTSVIERWVSYP